MGWEEQFEAMRYKEYYPGSNKEIIRKPTTRFVEDNWDSHPRILKVGGVEMEFFTVGQLGRAMNNRKPVTMRKWEQEGIIPRATYQIPSEDSRGRRRLYTRAQVEGMVNIAKEENVFDGSKPIKYSDFSVRVLALFERLRAGQ